MVSELLTETGDWDMIKLNDFFNQETVTAILKGGQPLGQGSDHWVWTKEGSSQFTSKSTYLIPAMKRAPHYDVAPSLWNKIWNNKILERHKVMWWSVLSSTLPTRGALLKRFHITDNPCPICGMEEETMEHLFLHWDLAFHLWQSSPWGIFPVSGTGIRMWDWIKFLWNLKSRNINTDEVFLYASTVIDTIWRVRNDKVHNQRIDNVNQCIDFISHSYAVYRDSLIPSPAPNQLVVWEPPPQDWIKLNCDVRVDGEHSCVAVIARDLSKVIWVYTTKLDFSDALCGEAAAVCLVLEVAKDKGHNFILVESDSKNL
ncbi:uncharacterized protein LOC133039317 [Cannabis sativa]|uniref:uncharacterized protein LOC133039317 n=1 Tax=Cannabis sativa TaxID=3483 RepID=UPI0029C9BB6A|nr:uncharacterized protein LOC133039317 [Cannabis sativa]